VSATVPNTQVCGPPPKQKAIYATAYKYNKQDEVVEKVDILKGFKKFILFRSKLIFKTKI
jgi:hypothetical protein